MMRRCPWHPRVGYLTIMATECLTHVDVQDFLQSVLPHAGFCTTMQLEAAWCMALANNF